jgi:hypothetical protein
VREVAKKIKMRVSIEKAQIGLERGFTIHMAGTSQILAKDSKAKKVLVGGLGCLGVGSDWWDMSDSYFEGMQAAIDRAPEVKMGEESMDLVFGS